MLVRSLGRSLGALARNSVGSVTLVRPFLSFSGVSETATKKAAHLARSALSNLGEETCLTEVPGVGPKTLEKLRAAGVETVKELRERVLNELRASDVSGDVPRILKLKLGVRHKRHARMISDFLNITTADVEEYTVHHAKDDDKMTHPNIKVAVEGNISSGKSTFLQAVGQLSENLRSTTQFIPEPVEMWTDHNGNNILDAFRQDPQRHSYAFQSFVFTTRVLQEKLNQDSKPRNRLIERSVFSDLFILIRALKNIDITWMSEMEYKLLHMYINPAALVKVLPQLVPDGFIYLRTPPGLCYARLHEKQRVLGAVSEYSSASASAETQRHRHVTLKYLEELHWCHERWFDLHAPSSHPFGHSSSLSELPRDIRAKIPSQLQSGHSHVLYNARRHVDLGIGDTIGSCSRPTLVLNSGDDCDINRNVEHVEAFFEFLQDNKSELRNNVS